MGGVLRDRYETANDLQRTPKNSNACLDRARELIRHGSCPFFPRNGLRLRPFSDSSVLVRAASRRSAMRNRSSKEGARALSWGFAVCMGANSVIVYDSKKTNRTQSQNRHSRHARELGFCDCGGTGSGDCARRAAGAYLQRPRRGGQVGLCRGFRRRAWSVGLDGISWRANTKARRV